MLANMTVGGIYLSKCSMTEVPNLTLVFEISKGLGNAYMF